MDEPMSDELPGYLRGGFNAGKYIIAKANGKPVASEARYFVLRYDKDPHARAAMLAYVKSIAQENACLAVDLVLELAKHGVRCDDSILWLLQVLRPNQGRIESVVRGLSQRKGADG